MIMSNDGRAFILGALCAWVMAFLIQDDQTTIAVVWWLVSLILYVLMRLWNENS